MTNAVVVSLFIIMGLYSCVYAYRRLTKPGMSEEIRKIFIRKHISYVSVYIIIWTFSLSSTYYDLYLSSINSENSESKLNILLIIRTAKLFSCLLSGFILSIIRAREPYFKFLIYKQIREFFGMIVEEDES